MRDPNHEIDRKAMGKESQIKVGYTNLRNPTTWTESLISQDT